MKKQNLVWLFSVLIVAGAVAIFSCSHQQTKDGFEKGKRFTLLYQANRYSEMEPCGCTSTPYGGVDREANAIEKIKDEGNPVLVVDAGNTLGPQKIKGKKQVYINKAKALVEMLNDSGLEVFAPGEADYALGLDTLRKLEEKAKFKFVATNVKAKDGTQIFAPYQIIKRKGVRFAFVSATPASVKSKEIRVEAPLRAVSRIVNQIQPQADVIVLLAQGQDHQKEKFWAKSLPEVDIVIGSDKKIVKNEAVSINNGGSLLVDAAEFGFLLGRLDLAVVLPMKGLYSPEQIALNKKRLKEAQDGKNRVKKKSRKARYQKFIDNIKQGELAPVPGGSRYSHSVIPLTKEEYGSHNPIKTQMEAYKSSLRKKAIAE